MADASAKIVLKTRPSAGRDSFIIADGVTLYEGQLVGVEDGFANHWDDDGGTARTFAGIALGPGGDGFDVNTTPPALTGDTSATPQPEVRVDTSGVVLMHLDSVGGTPAQSKVGDLVYSVDSDIASISLTDTTGDGNAIGYLLRFRTTTDVDVKLFSMAEHAAMTNATALGIAAP